MAKIIEYKAAIEGEKLPPEKLREIIISEPVVQVSTTNFIKLQQELELLIWKKKDIDQRIDAVKSKIREVGDTLQFDYDNKISYMISDDHVVVDPVVVEEPIKEEPPIDPPKDEEPITELPVEQPKEPTP